MSSYKDEDDDDMKEEDEEKEEGDRAEMDDEINELMQMTGMRKDVIDWVTTGNAVKANLECPGNMGRQADRRMTEERRKEARALLDRFKKSPGCVLELRKEQYKSKDER